MPQFFVSGVNERCGGEEDLAQRGAFIASTTLSVRHGSDFGWLNLELLLRMQFRKLGIATGLQYDSVPSILFNYAFHLTFLKFV